MDYGGEDH